MKPDEIRKLKRGMLIQYPDGRIDRVLSTFRFPANTKYRKKGPKMYSDSEYIWASLQDSDFKILGFVKP